MRTPSTLFFRWACSRTIHEIGISKFLILVVIPATVSGVHVTVY
jgi:hypothetical protein